jgi:hypothetical protein
MIAAAIWQVTMFMMIPAYCWALHWAGRSESNWKQRALAVFAGAALFGLLLIPAAVMVARLLVTE